MPYAIPKSPDATGPDEAWAVLTNIQRIVPRMPRSAYRARGRQGLQAQCRGVDRASGVRICQ
jgi:hypothetical protein